ncbi:MAG: hypothetical protein ACLQGV_16480 [Bryobacteraceae bacterium]
MAGESSTYSPVVQDVDATPFSGSNLDSRAGDMTACLARTFVVGQRLAAQGADGNYYSRAIQANTLQYYQVTCDSDTATGTFPTANVPQREYSVEQPPFDEGAPFNNAWPSVSLTDKTKTYLDPQTGTLIKRVAGPGEWMDGEALNQKLSTTVFELNGAWTTPSNASSGATTLLVTCTGSDSAPSLPAFAVGWNPEYAELGGWSAAVGVDDDSIQGPSQFPTTTMPEWGPIRAGASSCCERALSM